MRFLIILTISALVLLAAAVLFDVNYLDYERPIPYYQWQKINFYDFKGLKKPGMTLHGVREFAYIKTARTIEYPRNGKVKITAYFYPSRSYVFAKHIRNVDLLKHELYHFHITEYFSRLLRQEVFRRKNIITRNEIEKLDEHCYELENDMQDRYDEDSYHSYVLKEQKKWERNIDSLLESLQKFSDPYVQVTSRE